MERKLAVMKTLGLLILFLAFFNIASAQKPGLIIVHTESGKEKFIKENKRIKITTLEGGKLVGRLQIIDENTIMLRGVSLELNSIKKVKKHTLAGSLASSIVFWVFSFNMLWLGVGNAFAPIGDADVRNSDIFGPLAFVTIL